MMEPEEKKGRKGKIGNSLPEDEGQKGGVAGEAVGVEERQEKGKKQAPFKINGIQKPSPIIVAYHASETDLIKMT